jgi:hypothetical protein
MVVVEWLYANWRVIGSLDPTLYLARYDILFWSLRTHQKLVKSTGDVQATSYGGGRHTPETLNWELIIKFKRDN